MTSERAQYGFIALVFIITLGLLACSVTMMVFSLNMLIEDFDVLRECDDFPLWIYVFVQFLEFNVSARSTLYYRDVQSTAIASVVTLSFGIWGTITMRDVSECAPDDAVTIGWINVFGAYFSSILGSVFGYFLKTMELP
jgi:hypothetical protein